MATQTSGPPSGGMEVMSAFDLAGFGDDSMGLLDDPMTISLDGAPASGSAPGSGSGAPGSGAASASGSESGAGSGAGSGNPESAAPSFLGSLAISAPPDAAMFNPAPGPESVLDTMPLPLSISVTPTGDAPQANGPPVRYIQSPTSQHKRVRSDPGLQQVAQSLQQEQSAQRPSLPDNMLSSAAASEELLRPLPINAVDVTTPKGFQDLLRTTSDSMQQPFRKSEPGPEIDAFLQEFGGPTMLSPSMNGNGTPLFNMGVSPMATGTTGTTGTTGNAATSPSNGFGKRKRDVVHIRHKSSPVELYENQYQLRMLAQQQQQQQQQQQPMSPFNPGFQVAALVSPTMMAAHPQYDPNGMAMTPPLFNLGPSQEAMQFAMPGAMATARSPVTDAAYARPQRGHHTGLSADMSEMSLEAMLRDDPMAANAQAFQGSMATGTGTGTSTGTGTGRGNGRSKSSSSYPRSPPMRGRKSSDSEQSRKAYKCGVCGQLKVGHVCTKPEMRYNWTQVDLDVTKGGKIMNCALICVKSKWIPQHPDNIEH